MKESPRPSSVISSLVGLVHDAYVRLHHRPPADNTGRTIDDLDQVQLDEDSLQLGYDDRGVRGVRLTATALRPPPPASGRHRAAGDGRPGRGQKEKHSGQSRSSFLDARSLSTTNRSLSLYYSVS